MGRKRAQPDPDARVIADPLYPGCFTVRVGGAEQSYVDLDDPTHLEFDYIQRMADVIDACLPRPDRIRAVHIGGAGMTLPRWVAHTRPTSAQVVFDIDGPLIDEVRRVAPLPPRSGIKVRIEDGRAGLEGFPAESLDLLVVDAYDGGQVPAVFASLEFFALAAARLSSSGLLLMNLSDAAPFEYARSVAAAVAASFGAGFIGAEAAVLRGRRFGNLLLVAAPTSMPMATLRRVWAGGAFPFRIEELQPGGWQAGTAPWGDDQVKPSPSWDGTIVQK